VEDIEELKRQGLSIRAISRLTGMESQDDNEVFALAGDSAVFGTACGSEQVGPVQSPLGRAHEGWGLECTGAAAGKPETGL
jgi:hypothetical protein